MPKQRRWSIKRSLDQAVLACDKAQNYMVKVGKEYEGVHPEYYEAFSVIVQALDRIKKAIFNLNENI